MNWSNGSTLGSRNLATGPVASHVYENPGVYTVALTATDGTNTVSNSCVQIVVQDPGVVFSGANTICVAATSTPTAGSGGCPAGANTAQQPNFVAAISSYALTGKRVLFKRGDTFTAASSARINSTGPGIVGAFGTGVDPIVRMTGNTVILLLSSANTPGINDWRVMDLELDGMSKLASVGIEADGGFNKFLALRLNIHDTQRGISAPISVLDYINANPSYPKHTIFEDWSILDSNITVIPGCNSSVEICDWRIYLAGKRITIQGNFLDNLTTGGSHVIRNEYIGKGVISNNIIAHAGAGQASIKLHAMLWTQVSVANPTGLGTFTEQVVIADNKLIGANNPWTTTLGPQNDWRDERLRDIIVERNWFTSGPGTQASLLVWAVDTTIRNNICDMTGGIWHQCFVVTRRGAEPPPTNVRVYNNTIYSGSTGDFIGVNIGGLATNVTVKNNLGSAPFATGPIIIAGTGASGFNQSNNLLHNSPSALFVNATPAIPANFMLKSLPNPARDTGLTTVPVFSDFFVFSNFLQLPSRPQNGVTDIGAVEGP
jgi:hypothetical protein